MIDPSRENVDATRKIEIFSTDQEKIKLLGEVLSSDVSRKILDLVFDQELSASEIATKTELSLELVRYHLQKMMDIGIIIISRRAKNTKSQEIKYYRSTKFVVMILPSQVIERAKKSKSLYNALNRIYRFSAIGIASLVSWMIIENISGPSTGTKSPMTTVPEHVFWSTIIPLVVIICGLVIERIFKSLKH